MNLVISGHILCYPFPKPVEGSRPTGSFNGERNQAPDKSGNRAIEKEVFNVFLFTAEVAPVIPYPIYFDQVILS
jgi:hypothetical protein